MPRSRFVPVTKATEFSIVKAAMFSAPFCDFGHSGPLWNDRSTIAQKKGWSGCELQARERVVERAFDRVFACPGAGQSAQAVVHTEQVIGEHGVVTFRWQLAAL